MASSAQAACTRATARTARAVTPSPAAANAPGAGTASSAIWVCLSFLVLGWKINVKL